MTDSFDRDSIDTVTTQASALARDAVYVGIGFTILAAQKLQVQRREAGQRLAELEERIDDALDQLQARLPDPAAGVLGHARHTVRAARRQPRRDKDATATTA